MACASEGGCLWDRRGRGSARQKGGACACAHACVQLQGCMRGPVHHVHWPRWGLASDRARLVGWDAKPCSAAAKPPRSPTLFMSLCMSRRGALGTSAKQFCMESCPQGEMRTALRWGYAQRGRVRPRFLQQIRSERAGESSWCLLRQAQAALALAFACTPWAQPPVLRALLACGGTAHLQGAVAVEGGQRWLGQHRLWLAHVLWRQLLS